MRGGQVHAHTQPHALLTVNRQTATAVRASTPPLEVPTPTSHRRHLDRPSPGQAGNRLASTEPLTELRPRDLDFGTGVLTVSRVVVETSPRFHPDGGWFLIKQYPKDQEHRRLRLGAGIVAKIKAHIQEHGLGDDDLLFAMPELPARPAVRALADPAMLGLTRPNESGRRYRHGTLSAYAAGRCRCEHCRGAYASYRAQRRAAGRDQPRRPRVVQTDGHIPRGWFRLHIWLPAAEAAQLPTPARVHGLRPRARLLAACRGS